MVFVKCSALVTINVQLGNDAVKVFVWKFVLLQVIAYQGSCALMQFANLDALQIQTAHIPKFVLRTDASEFKESNFIFKKVTINYNT